MHGNDEYGRTDIAELSLYAGLGGTQGGNQQMHEQGQAKVQQG